MTPAPQTIEIETPLTNEDIKDEPKVNELDLRRMLGPNWKKLISPQYAQMKKKQLAKRRAKNRVARSSRQRNRR